MDKGNLAKGLLAVPAVGAGIDLLTQSPVGETVGNVVAATDVVMNVGNSLINPLFQNVISASTVIGGASAGLLTHSVLKDLGVENKFIKYGLTGITTLAGFAGGTAAAPYLAAGGLSYAIGKHGWKYGKEAVKRLGGAAWGATGGVAKGAMVGGYNSIKSGFKGEQKINPVI